MIHGRERERAPGGIRIRVREIPYRHRIGDEPERAVTDDDADPLDDALVAPRAQLRQHARLAFAARQPRPLGNFRIRPR